jgi:SulP family sulfate permease
VHTLILDLDANDSLDITAAETLDKLIRELGHRQVRVGLAHLHAPVAQLLDRSGVMATVGADRTFPNLPAAVA